MIDGKQVFERIEELHSWFKELGVTDDYDHTIFNEDGSIWFNYLDYTGQEGWWFVVVPFNCTKEEFTEIARVAKDKSDARKAQKERLESEYEFKKLEAEYLKLKEKLGK